MFAFPTVSSDIKNLEETKEHAHGKIVANSTILANSGMVSTTAPNAGGPAEILPFRLILLTQNKF